MPLEDLPEISDNVVRSFYFEKSNVSEYYERLREYLKEHKPHLYSIIETRAKEIKPQNPSDARDAIYEVLTLVSNQLAADRKKNVPLAPSDPFASQILTDSLLCEKCGQLANRLGSGYRCENCGHSSGMS